MSADGESGEHEDTLRIPAAKFIDNVEAFLAGRNPEDAIRKLNSDYSTYKAVEQQLLHRKARLLTKLPDLTKALEMVDLLIQKEGEEVVVDYSLSDQIQASAKLKDVKSVKLWLGADVMLEYELHEAKSVLEVNLELAKKNLEANARDLELIKDCHTTVEVSIARIYNYDVSSRRKADKPALQAA